ncbi:hypothetical protein EDD85DRAFT_1026392 [Armillaria nabsnona]|nr:hypothetical protein EDD85DRAFT_1026392 [Armillaria nabsnona]
MNYKDTNTSKHSCSDSESSSLPPRKRCSPSLLLDERLSREDVERIVEVYLTRGPHDGLTEALLMQDNPTSRSLHVPILAIFAEQLLRFVGPYKKTEIDFLKISSSSLRGILQADEEIFDLVLNAAREVLDQQSTHQNVRDLFRLRPIRLPQPTYEYLKYFRGGGGNLASAAVLAWSSLYIGNYPAAIIAEIEGRLATPKLDGYGYIGAMIQSSGAGKSRTMHEIAAHVFTIPINIRKDSGGAPYPNPDAELRDCLIFPGLDPQFRYFCFLCVLFQKVREVLKILVGDEPGEDTALRWRSYLDEPIHRELLYGTICREARSLELNVTPNEKVKLTKRTKEAYRYLINTLPIDPNKKLKLLIYIDEAHTLMERGIIARSHYLSLCSAMANLDDPDHFIVFMSTSEALSLPKSHDLIVRAATLPAPFTVLPFDVCANIE